MDKRIQALCTDDIVQAGCAKYGLTLNELVCIGGFQNMVYEYHQNNTSYILRFTHSSLRTQEALGAELEWILHLSDHQVPVSRPILSLQGNWFETVDLGVSYFMVSSFEKAKGQKMNYPKCLQSVDLFEKCGSITGRMHQLAKSYKPIQKRHTWQQNYYLRNAAEFIPPEQTLVLGNCNQLMGEIMNLTYGKESYGLIHGDINVGNFFVDQDAITLFDFDECQYSWFVEDIAVQLYYMVYVYGNDSLKERSLQCQLFMEHFLRGYNRENTISDESLKQMPLFLRLREIIVYIGMWRSYDMTSLNDWTADYLTQSRVRIEKGISIIEDHF